MKAYPWILFDADETLFHFNAYKGLQLLFSRYDTPFSEEDYHAYEALNLPLWKEYQNGQINAQQLQQRRFQAWSDKLNLEPDVLGRDFLIAMLDICTPLAGAIDLLNALQGKAKLGIITNGFIQMQQERLERTGLTKHFELLVISEEVGLAKPHPGIFEHALARMGNPERSQVLMVGDNPEPDIQGGLNVGIETCWLNVHSKPVPGGIEPHYQVSSLGELHRLLLPKYM